MGGEKAKSRDDHMIEILDRAFPRAVAMKRSNTQFASAQRPAATAVHAPAPVNRPVGIVPAEDRAALVQLASAIEVQEVPAPAVVPAPAPAVEVAAAPVPLPAKSPAAAASAPSAPVDSMTAYAVAAIRSAEGPVRQAGREIGNLLVTPANASTPPANTLDAQLRSAMNDPARTDPGFARDWRDGDPLIPDGTWVIQIGAYANEADAVESIRKAVRAAPEELRQAVPVTIPVNTADNRTLYRSRFGGFEGEKQARNACGRLARQAIQCIPIPPANWALPVNPDTRDNRRG